MLPAMLHDTFLRPDRVGMKMLAGRRVLLPVLLLILPLAFVSCCAAANDYTGLPQSGDWVVTDKQVVEGVTELWVGNITVKSGGDLTLSNTVFIFNSTNTSHKGIFVEEGGKISLVGVRLTAVKSLVLKGEPA